MGVRKSGRNYLVLDGLHVIANGGNLVHEASAQHEVGHIPNLKNDL